MIGRWEKGKTRDLAFGVGGAGKLPFFVKVLRSGLLFLATLPGGLETTTGREWIKLMKYIRSRQRQSEHKVHLGKGQRS